MLLDELIQSELKLSMIEKFVDKAQNWALDFGPKLFFALVAYFVIGWIIKWLTNFLNKLFNLKEIDPSFKSFLLSLCKITMIIIKFYVIITILGIPMTGFAALLAGAGIAIGAALNGSLGNLAGGIMLMIFKPFKVGDIIEAQGNSGVVKEMGIMSTTILTGDNKTVFLPNGSLSTGVITNYNAQGSLRITANFDIDASNNIDKARKVTLDEISSIPGILDVPAPSVVVSKVANGAITLAIGASATQADYWKVFYTMQEKIKIAYDKHEILFPVASMVIKQA